MENKIQKRLQELRKLMKETFQRLYFPVQTHIKVNIFQTIGKEENGFLALMVQRELQ